MSFVIGSVTLDMGVSKDTGCFYEEVAARHHPVGSSSTILQSDGFESGIRRISGVTQSASVKSGLDTIFKARSNVTITDHRSVSTTGRITKLEFNEVHDITNLSTGTFEFEIELMKR